MPQLIGKAVWIAAQNTGLQDTVTLSGTSGSPNSQANDLGLNRVANASWEFRTDGTVYYSKNSNFTQFQSGTQWNDNQPTPNDSYWIRATKFSGDDPTSGALGIWEKVSGSGSTLQRWIWEATTNGQVVTSILHIEIASDSLGNDVVADGYYEGRAERQSFP